jgi:hypothetical protein
MSYGLRPYIEATPIIRLRPVLDELEPDLDDWSLMGCGEPLLEHRPTGCVFQIGYDAERLDKAGPVNVFMLYATLFHHGGPVLPPCGEDLFKIGREAILCFWMMLTDRYDRGMDLSGEVTISERDGFTGKRVDDAVQP